MSSAEGVVSVSLASTRDPVLDTWWQTETGMHMITTPLGEPMKPGFAGLPVPGIEVDVVDKDGEQYATRAGWSSGH